MSKAKAASIAAEPISDPTIPYDDAVAEGREIVARHRQDEWRSWSWPTGSSPSTATIRWRSSRTSPAMTPEKSLRFWRSRPEPIRQFHEAPDRDIDRRRRPGLALAGAFFVRSRDVGGP